MGFLCEENETYELGNDEGWKVIDETERDLI